MSESFFRLFTSLFFFIFFSEQILLASPYSIGGAHQALPLTTFHGYIYDPQGYLKESQEYLERLDGSRQRRNLTRFDPDGNEGKGDRHRVGDRERLI